MHAFNFSYLPAAVSILVDLIEQLHASDRLQTPFTELAFLFAALLLVSFAHDRDFGLNGNRFCLPCSTVGIVLLTYRLCYLGCSYTFELVSIRCLSHELHLLIFYRWDDQALFIGRNVAL